MWRPWRARQAASGLGLTCYELNQLVTYNAERARGIVHTPAWQGQMAALQERFDEHQWRERAERWGLDSSQA
jgi:hypothetical protein